MLRRTLSLSLTILTLWLFVDAQSADAQLFRRLENRIRSRIAAPPVTPPTAARPNTNPNARPISPTTQPRRVSPLPTTPRTGIQPRQATDPLSEQGRTANYPPTKKGGYGQSILATGASAATANTRPRPSLGLEVYESRTGVPGLTVIRIRDPLQAQASGLAKGDIIVAVDGKPTPTIASITERLKQLEVGQVIRATVVRGNQRGDLSIPVVASTIPSSVELASPTIEPRSRAAIAESRPTQSPRPVPNEPTLVPNEPTLVPNEPTLVPNEPTLVPVPDQIAADPAASKNAELGLEFEDARGLRGAMVMVVNPASPAATAGLKVGDRIVSVDGRFISGSDELIREVSSRSKADPLTLQFVRGNELIESVVDFRRTGEPKLAADRPQPTPAPAVSETKSSILNGFGSALGGLLSGGKEKKPKPIEALKPPANAADIAENGSENPFIQPVPEVIDAAGANKPTPLAVKPASKDVMALEDNEPISQVGFDSLALPADSATPRDVERKVIDGRAKTIGAEGNRKIAPEKELTLDPPSLETLELPAGEAVPVEQATKAEKSVAEVIAHLRNEIRLLEKRLRELEAKD